MKVLCIYKDVFLEFWNNFNKVLCIYEDVFGINVINLLSN